MPEYKDRMELNVKFSSDISFIASDACDRYLLQMYIAKGIQEAFELVGSDCNNFTEAYLRTTEQTLVFDDVAPVVRGRWIKLDMHSGMEQHKCSICNQECYVPTCMGEPLYAYCPNCGADMRDAKP